MALELFIERQVSGVIHCSAGANLDLLRVLLKKSIPLVDLDRQSGLENVDTVILDNQLGAALATRHLIDLGTPTSRHDFRTETSLQCSENGWLLSAKRFGPSALSSRTRTSNSDFREQSGRIATEPLLSLPAPPTAMLVANNEMMAGALFAIRRRRVKVPRDLSLVGFDDARWAQYSDPPLTVVSQPTEAMGQKAAELLLGRLRGERNAKIVMFKPELIVRRSTAPPRG